MATAGRALAWVVAWSGCWACASAPAQQVCHGDPAVRSSPTARFSDEGDGTVIDKETHLMWTRCSVGQAPAAGGCDGAPARLDRAAAEDQALALNRSGAMFFNDWRLPSLRELATITERRCENPRVNLAVFPGTPAATYWTSSRVPGDERSTSVVVLDLGARGVGQAARTEHHHLRLVRDAR